MTDIPADHRSPLEHERDAGLRQADGEAALLLLMAVLDCNAAHTLRLPATGATTQMGELMDVVEAIFAERDALRARAEAAEAALAATLAREAETQRRHDARLDAADEALAAMRARAEAAERAFATIAEENRRLTHPWAWPDLLRSLLVMLLVIAGFIAVGPLLSWAAGILQ